MAVCKVKRQDVLLTQDLDNCLSALACGDRWCVPPKQLNLIESPVSETWALCCHIFLQTFILTQLACEGRRALVKQSVSSWVSSIMTGEWSFQGKTQGFSHLPALRWRGYDLALPAVHGKWGSQHHYPLLWTKEVTYTKVLVLFLELCRHSKMKEHPLVDSEHERYRAGFKCVRA